MQKQEPRKFYRLLAHTHMLNITWLRHVTQCERTSIEVADKNNIDRERERKSEAERSNGRAWELAIRLTSVRKQRIKTKESMWKRQGMKSREYKIIQCIHIYVRMYLYM